MPRGRPKKHSAIAAKLANALAFVRVAQPHNSDTPYKTHCVMAYGWLMATDGVLSAGHQIDESLDCCPQTAQLHAAIAQCTKSLTIAQTDNGSLSVQSDTFSAVVPCLSPDQMSSIVPDIPCGQINDRLRTGFATIGGLASDNAEFVVTASILLRGGSMLTTDRKMVLEYWHGLDLPTLIIPKAFAVAIGKVDGELYSFGYSEKSVTFYFSDGRWIKSQLYTEQWPDIDGVFNTYQVQTNDVPKNFFDGVAAVEPFANGHIYIEQAHIKSHSHDGVGAQFNCMIDIDRQMTFDTKALQFLAKKINKIGFTEGTHPVAVFYGDNLRGVLMGLRE